MRIRTATRTRFTPDLFRDRAIVTIDRLFPALTAATFLVPAALGGLLTCARHGVQRWQPDISAAVIRLFEKLGWVWRVRWPTQRRLARLHAD